MLPSQKHYRHKLSKTKIYGVWNGMIARCYCASKHNYPYYQGKGIKVCDEWRNSPQVFINWALENGYIEGLTLDRKNSDLDYCPENCQFLTRAENSSKRIRDSGMPSDKSKNIKFKPEQIIEIRKMISEKMKIICIAKLFKVDRHTIYNIRDRKTQRYNSILG